MDFRRNGINTMKGFVAVCCVFIAWPLVAIHSLQDPYEAQPRIITENGNMIFMTSENRNISFRCKGSGKIKINDDDLSELVEKTKRNVQQLENFRDNEIAEMRQQINNLRDNENIQDLNRRLTRVENSITTLSNQVSTLDNTTRGDRNIRRLLATRVNIIQRLLGTDECQSNPCHNGGTCEDGYNKFICRCPLNWQGALCNADVNECAQFAGTAQGCQNGATCENTIGSYRCTCAPSWYGVHCTERQDVCSESSNAGLCGHGTCINRPTNQPGQPHYTCLCEQGWQTDGRNPACDVDIDECQSSRPPCSHNPRVECINFPGSFHCGGCPAGYSGNGYVCSDIDECLVNNGGCSASPMTTCLNTLGSRRCGPCPPGYQGDGVFCIYLGICAFDNGGCHPLATCVENQRISSSYRECRCPQGYVGSGMGVTGCMRSSDNTPSATDMPIVQVNPCQDQPCVRGSCVTTGPYSFRCNCPQGFAGQLCDIDSNECLSFPCQNGGTCQDQPGGFLCTCPPLYTGVACETEAEVCGAHLSTENGSFRYPAIEGSQYAHDKSCAWVITTTWGKVINASFPEFHLEYSRNCDFDFLQINDGSSASDHPIGRYCGTRPPNNGSIISNHNQLYFWFRSDASSAHDGFRVNWTSMNPVCGGDLIEAGHGAIASPGYPGKYPHGRDCFWTIRVPVGKRIKFQFATLQLEHHENCSYDFLQLKDGLREDDATLQTYCSTVTPPPIETSGSFARLYFHSDNSYADYGFHISYSSIPGVHGCGGLLTQAKGSFSSPAYPNHYSHNLECDWVIRAKPRERIRFKFLSIDIEDHPNCIFDYVELRDGQDSVAPYIGKYCTTVIPPVHTSSGNNLFIRFRTDHSASRPGFNAEYEIICGGVYEEPSGIVHSPNYPEAYPLSKECVYIIRQPAGKAIRLQFQGFDIEPSNPYSTGSICQYDYLEIRDGDSENSPFIGKLCGFYIPDDILSTHNVLWMKFKTDATIHNRGFLANYSTIDVDCGGIMAGPSGRISSPSHPEEYIHGANCNWIIRARSGHTIRLTFLSFVLEYSRGCSFDYVEVYDNVLAPSDVSRIGRYCGNLIPPMITSTDSTLLVVFKSDESETREGFSAEYITVNETSACGGEYRAQVGTLRSPNYPNNYPHRKECVWTISVPTGQQILLKVNEFKLESHVNCNYDYLEIRNGQYATSPLIGKYCGEAISREITSHGHQLWLKFASDTSNSAKGFNITWDGTVTGCGGRLTSASGEFSSPNYPSPCSSGRSCEWDITISKGNFIRMIFIDWHHSSQCMNDGLQLWSYSDSAMQSKMGHYCGDEIPEPVTVNTNRAVVKFRCPWHNNYRGFHIRYNTDCNVELSGRRGVIESPNYPDPYPANRNCTWKIRAPRGNTLNLTFSAGHLEQSHTDNCQYDYIEIKDLLRNDDNTLTRFCGPVDLSKMVPTNSSYVSVQFVTDYSVQLSGFHMEWTSVGCGGDLNKPEGTITSPDYPAPFPKQVTCEWHIRVDFGSSVEFTIQNYDNDEFCYSHHLKVIGGPDIQYPELIKVCSKISEPKTITSSGNNLLVQYSSGTTSRGQGFSATYRTIHSGCGGTFTTKDGIIHSKNFPQDYGANDECTWQIVVQVGHTVILNFTDFNVQPGNNCSAAYVAVYDGPEENNQLMVQHCGNTLPNPTLYKSRNNTMIVKMKADGSIASRGFQAKYITGCGSEIYANQVGTVTSLNYPDFLGNEEMNCTWIIRATTPGDRISLTFTSLNYGPISSYRCDNNRTFIDIYDGEDESGIRLQRICDSQIPPAFFSTGSSMYISAFTKFTPLKFRAIYREASTGCGGDYESLNGMFTSPGFPGSYELSEECVWTLYAGPGNKVSLNFRSFNLEISEYCNTDYVEIREISAMGRLLGRFCGQQILMNSTLEAYEKMWVKFSSNDVGTARGFQAEFNIATNVELSGSFGEISNPLHTLSQQLSETYIYKITVPMYKRVQITFTEFRVGTSWITFFRQYSQDGTCYPLSGMVQIYDGATENSPSLTTLCGADIPNPVISTSNEMMIKLLAKSYAPSQFLLKWSAVDYAPPSDADRGIERRCVHEITLTMGNGTVIEMPTNTSLFDRSSYSMSCEWILHSPVATRLDLHFRMFNFRETDCYRNKLEVFDGGLQPGRWSSLIAICSQEDYRRQEYILSSRNVMKMNISFLSYINMPNFSASAIAVCGGNVSDQAAGSIQSTLHPAEYPTNEVCDWHIAVRPGKTISVRIVDFDINSSPPVCREDYLAFRNGGSASSPPLGNGKYCGTVVPQIPDTTGNHLYVQFRTDYVGTGRGFSLVFEEKGIDCGGRRSIGGAIETAVISSPNYPSTYPAHTECDWLIVGSVGHRVRLDFNDHFDIPFSNECENDYVEIRDGGTVQSRPLSRYCGHDLPSVVLSSSNMMFVRFFSNANNPSIGFKATAKLAVCGGTIASNRETLSSPNYPNRYTGAMNCEWTIRGPIGHYMTLTFNAMDLPIATVCSTTDYVEIRDLNSTGELLGRYCGNSIPQPITSADNLVYVKFVTTGSNSKTGFQLSFESSIEVCGGELSSPSGIITSPNFPGLYPSHRICAWIIRVDPSRSIRLEFTDFDISTTVVPNQFMWCTDSVKVINGDSLESFHLPFLLASELSCGTRLPPPVESTGNTMTVLFTSDRSISGYGFRAIYSSDKEALCGGILPLPSGYFTTPGFHTNESYPNNLNCHWKLTNPSRINSSISFFIQEFSMESMISSRECRYDRLHFYDDLIRSSSMDMCGNMTPQVVTLPYADLNIHLKTDSSVIHKGFNISYKVQSCGGVIGGESVITSPNYPNAYGDELHCSWAILLPDDQQVHLRFTDFRLEQTTDCTNDYVIIRSGPSADSPSMPKYCGNTLPQEIRFHRSDIMIEFHSNTAISGNGFRLEVLPIIGGCGGVTKHERQKVISSPGFPGKYRANDECVWEIIVEQGYHVNISFIERFDIQQSSSCESDYIEIADFLEDSYQPIGQRLCGITAPSPIVSRGKQVRIMFRTDGNTEGDGFKISWRRGCGGILTGSEGTISSPGFPESYSDNLECTYILQGDPQHYLRLTFDPEYFNIENSNDCVFDRLEVYNGNTTNGQLLGKFCGSGSIPGPLTVKGSMLLKFITDVSIVGRGFIANYKVSECGGTLTAQTGMLVSPTNPDMYHNDMNCTWVIQGQQDRVIHLRFEMVDLEVSHTCMYDHVSVFDGPDIRSRLLAKVCDEREPFSIVSENNTLTVQFRTDHSISRTGFVATYRQTFGVRHGCGGTLNATSGSISSVDWDRDGNYEPDLNCVWIIVGTALKHLKFHFESFSLEDGNCSYDYLQIRDGHAPFSPVVDTFCGTVVPNDIILTTNMGWINFVTDGRENKPGFRMTYTSVDIECQETLSATNLSQSVQSPGYPRHYPVNSRCWWVITAPEQQTIEITFTDFELEDSPRCNKDFVLIREMSQDTGEHVFRRCGNSRPPAYRSTNSLIHVHFTSDFMGTGKGFNFTYQLITACNRTYTSSHDELHLGSMEGNCAILIEALAGYTITIYLDTLHISYYSDCNNTYLKAWDGPTKTSPVIITLCESYTHRAAVSSSRNKMLLELGGMSNFINFQAHYTTTNQGQGCGGPVHITRYGSIRSPANLSSNVGENLQCKWTITVKYNDKLVLEFENFNMQPTDNCTTNYIELYENSVEDATQLLGRYCNSNIQLAKTTNSDTALLKYVFTGNSTDNTFMLRIRPLSYTGMHEFFWHY